MAKSWKPVSEEPPIYDGWYLVYAPTWSSSSLRSHKDNVRGVMFSYFRNGRWGIEKENDFCVEQWMEVPKPKKVDIEFFDNSIQEDGKRKFYKE